VTDEQRAERLRAQTTADRHAQRMIEIFIETEPEISDFITDDFVEGIAQWPGLELRILESQQGENRDCSVAGAYLDGQVPKIIGVAKAAPARMRFTALHELGHHIQRSDDDLMQSLLDRPDQGRIAEEAACDLFAARILLPQSDVDRALGQSTPTAVSVRDLWQSHRASRDATAVAAVQKLSTDGHVLVVSGAGKVEFATSRGLPRIGRNSDQSGTGFVRTIMSTNHERVQGTTRFAYRDSISGERLYFEAAHDGADYWFVVAAVSSVPWETLALPMLDERTVLGYWWTCELCEHNWESFAPKHQPCGTPVCESCDRCSCRKNALKIRKCDECFLERSINEFIGDSRICIEC
jgi:hypothetical protein